MAFDIDKMKADGVSSHLIELASMNQETFLLLIARRLENDKFFQQFMGESAGNIEAMYPYAVAAGLMSEYDRKWLIDEGNPYKLQSGEVWYTGTLGECQGGIALALLTATDKANPQDLFDNSDDYLVYANGEPMPSITKEGDGESSAFQMTWTGTGTFQTFKSLETGEWDEVGFFIACPTNITDVEITVAHK